MPEPTPMPTCPMAETCKGIMGKPFSRSAVIVPGLIFIALGVLIIVEPRILAWIIAAGFILLGAGLLMAGNFVRKVGTRLQNSDQPAA